MTRTDRPYQNWRPSTFYERREVVRQAETVLATVPVADFIERYKIPVKKKRVRVNGQRRDALRMPDGQDIVISEVSSGHWQYAERYGCFGGGSILQLAMTYLPEYDLAKGEWDDIVIRLAEKECPEIVRWYDRRPVTQTYTEQERIPFLERVRQMELQQEPPSQSMEWNRTDSRYQGDER